MSHSLTNDSLPEHCIDESDAHRQRTDFSATQPDEALATVHAPVADVPRRLFGSFVEHVGRCVYGGIYEPDHASADSNGFRQDMIALTRELGVTCVRYPGGNFVSAYNWEDGTGPRSERPVRRDLAWHSTETNEVGIDDFYRWSQAAGTEIMLAVNMGTRGLQAALEELEYVNGAAGTALADRRIAHGIVEPMDIAMWCIGNEMDGPWQVGHMSADDYATAVDQVAHAMKLAESGLELVACGSSSAHMPTFGDWERTVLTKAYDHLDFVSAHAYYFERGAASFQDYLMSKHDMTHFIATVAACADHAKQTRHGTKDIALSFDEWGVWNSDVWNQQEAQWKAEAAQGLHHEPWPRAPHLLEDIYSVTDAVVEGSLMITLLQHCDRVRAASRAQLVNVIAPIMAEPHGPAWRQTVFYPFAEAAHAAKGTVYSLALQSPLVTTQTYGDVPAVDAVLTWDDTTGVGLILAVNLDAAHAHHLTVDVNRIIAAKGASAKLTVTRAQQLHDHDPHRTNTAEHPTAVVPYAIDAHVIDNTHIRLSLPAVSWSAVRFAVA